MTEENRNTEEATSAASATNATESINADKDFGRQYWPDWLMQLRQEALERFESIPEAVAWLRQRVRDNSPSEKTLDDMVGFCLKTLHYYDRHHYNSRIKENSAKNNTNPRQFNNDPRTSYAQPVNNLLRRYREVLALRWGGKTFGELTLGLEVEIEAKRHEQSANGHLFNAALLRWCNDNGREGQLVRNIPMKRLMGAYDRLQAQYGIKIPRQQENPVA